MTERVHLKFRADASERGESSAIQRAEFKRHVNLVRHRERTGERSAAGTAGSQVVMVIASVQALPVVLAAPS